MQRLHKINNTSYDVNGFSSEDLHANLVYIVNAIQHEEIIHSEWFGLAGFRVTDCIHVHIHLYDCDSSRLHRQPPVTK